MDNKTLMDLMKLRKRLGLKRRPFRPRNQLDDKIILNLAEIAAMCAHKMGEVESCNEHAHYMDCLFATLDIVYDYIARRNMEDMNGQTEEG